MSYHRNAVQVSLQHLESGRRKDEMTNEWGSAFLSFFFGFLSFSDFFFLQRHKMHNQKSHYHTLGNHKLNSPELRTEDKDQKGVIQTILWYNTNTNKNRGLRVTTKRVYNKSPIIFTSSFQIRTLYRRVLTSVIKSSYNIEILELGILCWHEIFHVVKRIMIITYLLSNYP